MSSSHNWEKDINCHSSEELKDVEKRVKDVDISMISTREAKRVRTENEAYNETTENQFPKMVKLNVGGHLFSTSLATLNKDPGDLKEMIFNYRQGRSNHDL